MALFISDEFEVCEEVLAMGQTDVTDTVSCSVNCYTEVTAGLEETEVTLELGGLELEFWLNPSSLQFMALCLRPGKPLCLQFEQ